MEFTWFSFLISTLIKHMQHSVTSSSGRPHRHRVMHRVSKFSLASERLSPGNRDLSHILRAASWPNVGSCPRREEGMPVGTRPWPITTHHTRRHSHALRMSVRLQRRVLFLGHPRRCQSGSASRVRRHSTRLCQGEGLGGRDHRVGDCNTCCSLPSTRQAARAGCLGAH